MVTYAQLLDWGIKVCNDPTTKPVAWVSACICGVGTIIVTTMYGRLLKYLWTSRVSFSLFFWMMTIFCATCWSGYSLMAPIAFGFCIGEQAQVTVGLAMTGTPMYYLGLIGVYILLAGRLHYTFQGSPRLRLSRRQRLFLLVPVPIYCVLYAFLQMKVTPNHASTTSVSLAITATLLYMGSVVHLVSLFVGKLLYLASSRYSMMINPDNTLELNNQQLSLIQVMTRYTILASLALTSTCVTVVVIAIGLLVKIANFPLELFIFVAIALDCAVNLTCLLKEGEANEQRNIDR
ncbi:hypothetical protein RFI_26872 [Reticulomyxa filosa]|uniref:Uncharacterized protein n=1 Tax=Reticulomyxa filosa TaxID=46433 RepID=X6MBT4_RETFI|nr:hypothetical protein RFI_26872 [Reticulomyxa filosa]|eukprot:ETO10505.1 hypothetical protein RFI_26872 [Reticulomyxa filosa]